MPKNLYEDAGRTPKPSERWKVKHREAQPPEPPSPRPPPDLSSMTGEATINAHARKLMEKSKRYE